MVIMAEEEGRRAAGGRADGQGRGPRQTQAGCMTWGRQRAESANGRHCLVGRGLGMVGTLEVSMESRDWYAPGD